MAKPPSSCRMPSRRCSVPRCPWWYWSAASRASLMTRLARSVNCVIIPSPLFKLRCRSRLHLAAYQNAQCPAFPLLVGSLAYALEGECVRGETELADKHRGMLPQKVKGPIAHQGRNDEIALTPARTADHQLLRGPRGCRNILPLTGHGETS